MNLDCSTFMISHFHSGINSHDSLSVPVSNTRSHSEPQLSSHNHTTLIIPYAVVAKATELFNETPVSEGGHKLGQGGFGQVFYCKLKMGDHEKEVAVKAFSDKVSTTLIQFSVFDKLIWHTIGPKSFLFGTAQFSYWASDAVNYDYIVTNNNC